MNKQKRQTRIRKNIAKVSDRPRLSVFRSNKYIYAQIIDINGIVLFGLFEKKGTTKSGKSRELGLNIAKVALEKKIKEVVFDKGRFAYHGNVKAVAEGAREGGLQF
jgi:large subunit ribosomal protein L18